MNNPHSLTGRMIRAARLEVDLYEEVEADTTATGQAFQSVLIASVASGIGTAIFGASGWALLSGVIFTLFAWFVWSFITYWIGTTILKGPETSATLGELLRTIGFAYSPMVLMLFIFLPFLGGLIAFAVSIWVLIAVVIAVRQALDFSTWRAIGTCIVGWIVLVALQGIVVALFG